MTYPFHFHDSTITMNASHTFDPNVCAIEVSGLPPRVIDMNVRTIFLSRHMMKKCDRKTAATKAAVQLLHRMMTACS